MFAQAIETLLTEKCTPAVVRAVDSGGSAQVLATILAGAGFYELMAPEESGGGAASWNELFEVVLLCGAHAVPLPLAQTIAARTITSTPDQLPAGLLTFAPSLARGLDGSVSAMHVPFARTASHVIAATENRLLVLSLAEADRLPSGIQGSLAESIVWRADAGKQLAAVVSGEQFRALGALLHAGLLAGAMKRVFDLTMTYANQRVQFGKSIGKFQAIQQQLSVMAEHVAAARIATEAAFAAAEPLPPVTACAVAKARTSEAAQLVASVAHALHGAIGVTEEYDLQLFTRRLHEWRIAHGSEAHWNRLLGRLFLDSNRLTSVEFVRSLFPAVQA
ncbi:acyl-CoA dehydrogenase [Bradyrhizobium sp. i1.4.4]|uniref:acyl-CoA dehydrogenase family protein n=1 Tax=unclassified Bradyrhizobium TaxID=2631580 RepID=UPI003392B9D5